MILRNHAGPERRSQRRLVLQHRSRHRSHPAHGIHPQLPHRSEYPRRHPQTDLPNTIAINGSAFSTASFGAASTIYFLLQYNDGLYTSAGMAAGAYTSIGATGADFAQPAGLAISGSNMFMAAMAADRSNCFR